MEKAILAIRVDLVQPSGKATELLIHRMREESASPCFIVEDGERRLIGGHIETLEELVPILAARYPGCVVMNRFDLVRA